MKKFFAVILLLLIGWFSLAFSQRSLPSLTGPVVDEAHLLSSSHKSVISAGLQKFYQQTGRQIQVVIVQSLEGEVLEDFSIRLAEHWKIGKKERGSGVILLISQKDQKIRIEVGEGLEGELTDLQASRIIRGTIAPYFKQKNYAAGISAGIQAITGALGGEIAFLNTKTLPPLPKPVNNLGYLIFILIWFFLVFPFIFRRRNYQGRHLFWAAFLASLLGSGHRSGGFGNGGFGGGSFGGGWFGGGGGFSGGGASGGW